jgi:catechol 2,3-dioxygenase-like lactoylglutathione lyase family enzyme
MIVVVRGGVHARKVPGYDGAALLGRFAPTAFVAVTDPDRARAFYEEILGLELVADEDHALVFDAGDTTLRLAKVAELNPAPHTVLGWQVPDLEATIDVLAARGVNFRRYGQFEQDERDIWTAPDGTRVAWFDDPDGNLLSLMEGR